jgi:hypothetical protein
LPQYGLENNVYITHAVLITWFLPLEKMVVFLALLKVFAEFVAAENHMVAWIFPRSN